LHRKKTFVCSSASDRTSIGASFYSSVGQRHAKKRDHSFELLDNFMDDPPRILKYKNTIGRPLSFIQAFLSSSVGLGLCGGDRLNCENSKSIEFGETVAWANLA
jgi:hypothetical protein